MDFAPMLTIIMMKYRLSEVNEGRASAMPVPGDRSFGARLQTEATYYISLCLITNFRLAIEQVLPLILMSISLSAEDLASFNRLAGSARCF